MTIVIPVYMDYPPENTKPTRNDGNTRAIIKSSEFHADCETLGNQAKYVVRVNFSTKATV